MQLHSDLNPEFRKLSEFCSMGDLAALRDQFPTGPPPDLMDKYRSTLLHHVAITYHTPILEWLLSFSPDLTRTNQFGNTPLWLACRDHRIPMARLLLMHGANVHETDPFGNTLLHLACRMGFDKLALLLLEWGVDPDAVNHANQRPTDLFPVCMGKTAKHQLIQTIEFLREGCGLK
jgi:ankyrin repeat protein